jgi:hypothetical protein
MPRVKPLILLALAATVALSACARKEGTLMNLRSPSRGPDEFSILPTKPLELPKDLAALPEPTPGGGNLTDPTPRQDAVRALGGNPKALTANGIPAADSAVVNTASRYGVAGDIRAVLAEEDREFRRKNPGKLLERLFRVTAYFNVYEDQSLDRYAELRRMRRSGIRTPAAPPEPEKKN